MNEKELWILFYAAALAGGKEGNDAIYEANIGLMNYRRRWREDNGSSTDEA
ncbi:MAG: hypothetical protein KAJ55_17200 [Anaerolineales bacterium]|nr:hypothetical protein [Anaerolineales bacterium]